MKKIIYTSVVLAGFIASCKSSKQTTSDVVSKPLDCSTKTVTYNLDIKPIMEGNCTRCHNKNEKAGYNFLTMESVKKAGQEGKLLGTIKHQKGFPKMPMMSAKLSQESIDIIECWINNGMKE